jgi:hypothetical protein
MQISKSTRHSKIVGDFGEHLVCNWLSRSGFEVSIVDHTGIDILAYEKALDRRLGISVKSRSRLPGSEADGVFLFRKAADRESLLAACKVFACTPWLAVYVESEAKGDLFLTGLSNYDLRYGTGGATESWSMTPIQVSKYAADSEVRHIHIDFKEGNWW